jgi:hypothetical protein
MPGFVMAVHRLFLLPAILAVPAVTEAQFTFTTNTANHTIVISQYTGSGGAVVIPSTLGGLPVTTIGNTAFEESGVTSVDIPFGITNIGGGAFSQCTNLTSIALPSSLTTTANGLFEYCTSLTNVTIPSSVTNIGDATFYGCTNLAGITIPDSVVNIGAGAFAYCTALTNITIPASVLNMGAHSQTIALGVFQNCTNLTTVTIPASVTCIGFCAFQSCSGLVSVVMGNGATNVPAQAFLDCVNLTNVAISTSATIIEDTAFAYCWRLTSVTIPDSVTNIEMSAFYDCFYLTNVSLGSGLVIIGNSAFYDCARLSSIAIPSQVAIIDDEAFEFCADLTTVTVPDSVTTLGSLVFGYCTGLTNITIGQNVTSIGEQAFYDCYGLASAALPNGITNIASGVFWNCSNLTSVVVPGGVSSIQSHAFDGCSGLSSVVMGNGITDIEPYAFSGAAISSVAIPNTVTNIESYAFEFCSNLRSVVIPGSVVGIGSYAFQYCTNLSSVTLGSHLAAIGDYAFTWCASLAEIAIPDSVTNLGNCTFEDCDTMTNVTIGNGLASIGWNDFSGCAQLASVTIGGSVTNIGDLAFANCGLTSVTIPDNVVGFGDDVFEGCASLTNVWIGAGLTNLGWSPFYGCGSLDAIAVDPSNQVYSSLGGVLFNQSQTVLALCPGGKAGTYAVPNSVTNIAASAFSSCAGLTGVAIPNGVVDIGDDAFYGCSNLANIDLPDSVVSLGNAAFSDCVALTNVTLSAQLDSIQANAFSGCDGLSSITIPNSVASIGASAFYFCTKLTSVTIGDGVTNIGDDAFFACGLATLTIPSGVTSIGNTAFSGNVDLTSAVLANTVTNIGSEAFSECVSLTNFSLPNTLTTIQNWFSDCPSLASITIPGSVTNLGAYAFSGCGLTHITIPDSVTAIANDAFYDCTALTSVIIGNGVTTIGDDAFYVCPSLASVTLGNQVSYIGSSAFWGCPLTGITLPASLTYLDSDALGLCANLRVVNFQGNVPTNDSTALANDDSVTVYYLPGTTNWGASFCGFPTVAWNPLLTGSLQLNLAPAGAIGAGAQWQVDGGAWQASGVVVSNLMEGSHTVGFAAAGGWTTPTNQTVTISSNALTAITVTYASAVQTGSLQVNLAPAGAISAGAQWQVDGGAWQASGVIVTNLTAGNHTVAFSTVAGWTAPTNQTVTVAMDETTTVTGTYTVQAAPTGALTVNIAPAGAISAGAEWEVDGGAWQASGVTISNLAPGSHVVVFATVTNWITPPNATVTLSSNSTSTVTGNYTAVQDGSLQVNLAPAGAVTAGAKWQVDAGAWQASGATVTNLSPGSHSVAFSTATGWVTPASQTITIVSSVKTTATGTYSAAQVGSLQVSLGPAAAVSAGALWQVDGGAWEASGVIVTNLTAGNHTVAFGAVSNWTAPASQSVTISANHTTTASGTYAPGTLSGITISGNGTISPNLSSLQIGKQYKVTAMPASGYVFSGWTGSIVSNNATLTFTAQAGMVLQANFIVNPFTPIAGTYEGLFFDSGNVAVDNAGMVTITPTGSGSFSGKLGLGGRSYSLSGQLSLTGYLSKKVPLTETNTLTVTLQFDLAGSGSVTGTVSNGAWSVPLTAFRAGYSRQSVWDQSAKYTLLIPGGADPTEQPSGDGFGAVTVSSLGLAKLSGSLADGTPISTSASVSGEGLWPFYASLYSGKGVVLGWLSFTNQATNDIAGQLTWIKEVQPARYYSSGFSITSGAMGSAYVSSGGQVLGFTNGQAWMAGEDLPSGYNCPFTVTNDRVVSTNKSFKLTFTASTGLFGGSVANPAGADPKTLSFRGAVLQKQNLGGGFFLETNYSGQVEIAPDP